MACEFIINDNGKRVIKTNIEIAILGKHGQFNFREERKSINIEYEFKQPIHIYGEKQKIRYFDEQKAIKFLIDEGYHQFKEFYQGRNEFKRDGQIYKYPIIAIIDPYMDGFPEETTPDIKMDEETERRNYRNH